MPTPKLTAALRRLAPDDTPDGELLARYVREQDEAAFAALVRRHGGMVRTVCQRVLRNDADADDAVQATFLVLVRKASAVRDRNGLANWLFGVAHNVALKARQSRTRRTAKETRVPPRSPEAVASDFAELLHAELAKLSAAARGVIVLCDLEGRTIADAARDLGIPAGTVASRLARGREQLAKRLAKYGLSVSGGLVATLFGVSATAAVAFDPAALKPHIHTLANEVIRTMFTTARITKHVTLLGLLITLGGGMLLLRGEAKEPDLRVTRRNAPVPKAKQPDPKEVLAKALDLARMKVKGMGDRTTCTFAIAVELVRCGDKEAAKKAFEMGLFDLPGNWPSRLGLMAREGFVDVALERAAKWGETDEQSIKKRKRTMAEWLRGSGDVKTLTKLAGELEGDDREYCLGVLACEQAGAGKLADAAKTIESIRSDGPKQLAISRLAVAHHKAKDPKQSALLLAETTVITDRIVKQGGARESEAVLAELAWAQAFSGSPADAKRTIERLVSPFLVRRSLAEVAVAELSAGDPKAAVRTTNSTESNYQFGGVRARVVEHYAARGEWGRATEVADSIKCGFWKVQAYRRLAVAYTKAGKLETATETLAKATDILGPSGENINDAEPGYLGLRKSAQFLHFRTLTEMGQAEKALTEARGVEPAEDRVQALLAIARGLRAPLSDEEELAFIRWR